MGDKSLIEWTGATWNPLVAFVEDTTGTYTFDNALGLKWKRGWFCVHASEGCRNCYAEKMNLWRGNGLTYKTQNLPLVRSEFVGLDQPIRWQRPRMIFVCSMTDLFADFYTDEQINQVFKVMFKAKQHIFQVLTKRAERMYDYISRNAWLTNDPLPNVWLGVSVENQQTADARIPALVETPAAVRWLSCEPLLGLVNLEAWLTDPAPQALTLLSRYYGTNGFDPTGAQQVKTRVVNPKLGWVVAGGESGKAARPMHPDWPRLLREQCVMAAVPFFFKQWGEFVPSERGVCAHPSSDGAQGPARLLNRIDVWKCGLCNTLHGDGFDFVRVGKKEAGRTLDGRTWDEMPA